MSLAQCKHEAATRFGSMKHAMKWIAPAGALIFTCAVSGCACTHRSSHIRVDGAQQTAQLRAGQNAQIHYVLDEGERRHRYCYIHSVNDRWLAVYDKVESSFECTEMNGRITYIPIDTITLIVVDE